MCVDINFYVVFLMFVERVKNRKYMHKIQCEFFSKDEIKKIILSTKIFYS